MLSDLIRSHREELISRTRAQDAARPVAAAAAGVEDGVPLFLTQLAESLRLVAAATPFSPEPIGVGAARHARALLATGWAVSDVVHDYAGVCRAMTELAGERGATLSVEELQTVNRCLDVAIAEGVTEYERLKEEATSHHDLERRGQLAHDLRNAIQTALLSFKVLEARAGAASGPAGAALGRSLGRIRDLVETIVAEVQPAPAPAARREAAGARDAVSRPARSP
jgi:hypothetical protein